MHNTSKIKFIDKKIDQEHIFITYPQFKLKHKTLQNKINKAILDIIVKFIEKESYLLKDNYSLYSEFNVTLNTKNLISLIIEFYFYNDENNSSHSTLQSLTIRTTDAYIYDFNDLFIEGINYENIISKIILEYIRDNGVPIVEELANINKNKSFYFTNDSLVVYYNLNKNSLYSSNYWIPQFYIPIKSIKNIINPEAISLKI